MKTLLTFQSTEASLQSIDNIATTAINMDAHLHVLVVGLATLVPVSVYADVPAYDWSANYNQIIKDTQQKTIELADHLKKLGVTATTIPVCDAIGAISSIAADSALYADFAVVPAGDGRQPDDNLRKMFLEGVMFSANTPTILLPDDKVINNPLNRVVVGWHPAPNAAAAVRSCLSLLDKTTDINITVVDSSPAVYGLSPGSDMATFFSRHNANTSIDLLSSNSKPIGEMLLQHSKDINADLLVMGAFGRSRFREWLLGGTTRDVFESMSIPTLVSH